MKMKCSSRIWRKWRKNIPNWKKWQEECLRIWKLNEKHSLILFQKCPLAPPQGEYRIFASNLYFFSPRTESTKSSSVYVLPLPVLDTSFGTSESIDDENKENNQPLANIKVSFQKQNRFYLPDDPVSLLPHVEFGRNGGRKRTPLYKNYLNLDL